MNENEPKQEGRRGAPVEERSGARGRTPLQELIVGVLLVVVVGAGIMVAAWAVRLHDKEERLRALESRTPRAEAAPPKHEAPRTEPQPAGPVATKTDTQSPQGEGRRTAPGEGRRAAPVQHLQKLVEWEHDRNLAAIELARRRLDAKFAAYSERIPEFTDALNSLTEKLRLGRGMVEDKVRSGGQTQLVAVNLFSAKVVSDSALRTDILDVVAAFQRDVESNRAATLAAAGPGADLPKVADMATLASVDLLVSEFKEGLGKFLKAQGEQVPEITVRSLSKSVSMAETMGKRVTDAIKEHDDAKEGGETASEAKRATILGTAVGVLAGAADYWLMQSRFESAQTAECRIAFDRIRDALWSDPRNGLQADFTSYADLVRATHALSLGARN